jgi:hypothetical protein
MCWKSRNRKEEDYEDLVHRISELRKEGQRTKKAFTDKITLDQSVCQGLQPR